MLLSIDYIPPPDLTGLTIIPSSAGMSFVWDNPIDASLWAIEIWEAATNNRTGATLLDTVVGTNTYEYISLGTGVVTHYFWVRAKGIYGQTNGNWYPVSSTAGISGVSGTNNTLDITPNAVTSTTLITSVAPVALDPTPHDEIANIYSVNFTGESNPVNVFTSASVYGYYVDSGLGGYSATYFIHSLVNTTAGGTDTLTTYRSYGTSGIYTSTVGGGAWTSISNIQATDAVFATATANASGVDTFLLTALDFATDIPSTATLLDIGIQIKAKYSGAGTAPTLIARLCWDSADFPTLNGDSRSEFNRRTTLTTTNTLNILGGATVTDATWGNFKVLSTGEIRPIKLTDIRDSLFGIKVAISGTTIGQVISIDSIKVAVRYSTKEYAFREVVQVFTSITNTNSTRRVPVANFAATPTNGASYTLALDWLRSAYVPPDAIYPTRENVITSMQVYRR